MTKYKKIARPASLLVAAVVAFLTVGVMVHATQTITTPNASVTTYSLAAGATSSAITPPSGVPVLVMGVNTTFNYRGVGQVTMQNASGTGAFLEWVGLESPSAAAITSGYSAVAGTHILYIDYNHQVSLEVHTANSFIIHNASSITQAGSVTMIW